VQPLTDGTRGARVTLLGDLLGLVAFLVVGLNRHGEDVVSRFLALAAIFAVAWIVVALALGTYRDPSPPRVVSQIILAITLAVAVRAAFVRAWTVREVLTFAVVGVIFGAFFVGIARLVTSLILRRDAAR
jgi:hypothetical protein